ncbi:hypothetical protein LLE49_23725 [Alicyclobacillus tolerans]|uniref:hypothetical protein n=1 Tax=Alicyclobacillus tolerans TaxID=90970 RepID=UPI001F2A39FF|nr:hypothetical protein [Alicyclobacillus tolerans]MCF8567734.1 hypothetical protein [Alicyclobacillus tolerans]
MAVQNSFLGFLPMILIPLALICAMFGVYFVLKAIWALRTGENEKLFIRRGLIGVALIVVPWFVLWIGVAGLVTSASQSGTVPIQSGSIPIQPNGGSTQGQ